MARLHEYQGKEILKRHRIGVPKGRVISSPGEARAAAESIGGPVVVKAQAWTTGRAGLGAIRFAANPGEAEAAASSILGMTIGSFTVDDYGVFRHPELGVEIAREFDRPPSELEKIAWKVESGDYRGTFYFIQMEQGFRKGDRYVGFHGAGGGGSMMSMDAALKEGFRIANFTDTSGNPPASKVYRAAKIILSQPGIDGYFASGSGVASQEQFHSARGLIKAFWEENPGIPAVIRLGGNQEERAIAILTEGAKHLAAPLEAFGKNDSADACAARLRTLLDAPARKTPVAKTPLQARPAPSDPYTFKTVTGSITYDHQVCRTCETKPCITECVPKILKSEDSVPVLNISREDAAKGKCIECLACETECVTKGKGGAFIDLPIEGLEAWRTAATAASPGGTRR